MPTALVTLPITYEGGTDPTDTDLLKDIRDILHAGQTLSTQHLKDIRDILNLMLNTQYKVSIASMLADEFANIEDTDGNGLVYGFNFLLDLPLERLPLSLQTNMDYYDDDSEEGDGSLITEELSLRQQNSGKKQWEKDVLTVAEFLDTLPAGIIKDRATAVMTNWLTG